MKSMITCLNADFILKYIYNSYETIKAALNKNS